MSFSFPGIPVGIPGSDLEFDAEGNLIDVGSPGVLFDFPETLQSVFQNLDFGVLEGSVFVPGVGFEIPAPEIEIAPPPTPQEIQDEINRQIEEQILEEREREEQLPARRTGEEERRLAEFVLGLPPGSLTVITQSDIEAIALATGLPISTVLETVGIDEPEPEFVSLPPTLPLPREETDPGCPPCPEDRRLPPFVFDPNFVFRLVTRLGLSFPLNVSALVNVLRVVAGGGSVARDVVREDPGIPLSDPLGCKLFTEPTCQCVCQSPVRSCCGGGCGCGSC